MSSEGAQAETKTPLGAVAVRRTSQVQADVVAVEGDRVRAQAALPLASSTATPSSSSQASRRRTAGQRGRRSLISMDRRAAGGAEAPRAIDDHLVGDGGQRAGQRDRPVDGESDVRRLSRGRRVSGVDGRPQRASAGSCSGTVSDCVVSGRKPSRGGGGHCRRDAAVTTDAHTATPAAPAIPAQDAPRTRGGAGREREKPVVCSGNYTLAVPTLLARGM